MLKSDGSWKLAISTLANQARKPLFKLIKKRLYPPLHLMYKCFDTLVTPILENGCQIWGFQAASIMEIENVHRKFCKFLLHVPSSATDV